MVVKIVLVGILRNKNGAICNGVDRNCSRKLVVRETRQKLTNGSDNVKKIKTI